MKKTMLLLMAIVLVQATLLGHCPKILSVYFKKVDEKFKYKVVFEWNGEDPFRIRFSASSCSTWCEKIEKGKFSQKDSLEGFITCVGTPLFSVSTTLGNSQECLNNTWPCETILPLYEGRIKIFSINRVIQLQWSKLSGKGIEKSYDQKEWKEVLFTRKASGSTRYSEPKNGSVFYRDIGGGPVSRVVIKNDEAVDYFLPDGRFAGKVKNFSDLPKGRVVYIRASDGTTISFIEW